MFDAFLDCHLATLTSLRIKDHGPVDFVLRRFDTSLHEAMGRFDVKVASFWMTKEGGRWSVREMEATIHVSAEDKEYLVFEEALRVIGSLAPDLRTFNLTVSYKGFANPTHITATRYLEVGLQSLHVLLNETNELYSRNSPPRPSPPIARSYT